MAELLAHDALAMIRQQKAIRAERRKREQQRRTAELQDAIEAARAGDPFPYIGLQWGRILRADDVIAEPAAPSELRAKGERFLILDDFQHDILASLWTPGIPEVYVKGNTGCGKGGAAGIAICTYFATWPDARVVVTRDSAERAGLIVVGEAKRWWRRMLLPPAGCVALETSIKDTNDSTHEVRVANPDSTEGFTGAHAPHVLFVFDEATAKVLERFFALVPTMAHKFLALANPRTTGGAFHRAFNEAVDEDQVDVTQTVQTERGLRRLITVDGDDILNVRLRRLKHPVGPPGGLAVGDRRYEPGEPIEARHIPLTEAVVPGQTCYDEHRAICASGDADHVACYGHGRFPQNDKELAIFMRRWFVAPREAWRRFDAAWRKAEGRPDLRARLRRWFPVRAFGLDVGGSTAGDPSVLTAGGDRGIFRQFEGRYEDATALADWVIETARDACGVDLTDGGVPVGIDNVGIGWGVCGILRQQGVRVIELAGNLPSEVDPKTYANLRAEGYGELARRLDVAGKWGYAKRADAFTPDVRTREQRLAKRRATRELAPLLFLVPPDPRLEEECRAHDKVFGTDGKKHHVTPKRPGSGLKEGTITVVDKIGRSPDRSDSAWYFYRALQSASIGLEEALDHGFF